MPKDTINSYEEFHKLIDSAEYFFKAADPFMRGQEEITPEAMKEIFNALASTVTGVIMLFGIQSGKMKDEYEKSTEDCDNGNDR